MVGGPDPSHVHWYQGQPLYAYSYRPHAHPTQPPPPPPPRPLLVTTLQPKPLPRGRQRPYTRRQSLRRGRGQASAGMGALASRGMKHVKSDGNGNIEREDKPAKAVPCFLPVPAELQLVMDRPVASRAIQLRHAWNPNDRSLNIFVKEDDEFTFHR